MCFIKSIIPLFPEFNFKLKQMEDSTFIDLFCKEKRYITPRECARLQSFPDSFKLSESDKISYKQLGNSVNVYTIVKTTLEDYF